MGKVQVYYNSGMVLMEIKDIIYKYNIFDLWV